MKALDLIKEEIFPAEDKPWLSEFFSEEYLKPGWYAHCIYIDMQGEIRLIWGKVMQCPEKDRKRIGFIDYIEKHKPDSFQEILFLLDLYPRDPETLTVNFSQFKPSMGEVIEYLLKDSKGVILWHYQLENILNIFFTKRAEVLSIRKGINAKKADVIERVNKFHISETTTLWDFIFSIMCLGYTVYPNIQGAYVLYDLIKLDHPNA